MSDRFWFFRFGLFRFCAILLAAFVAGATARSEDGNKPVPRDLFSLNVINWQYGMPMPRVKFYGYRTFLSVWNKIEPENGVWKWGALDREVDYAVARSVEPMLVLQSPPTWASSRPASEGCCVKSAPSGNAAPPRSLDDWRRYVAELVDRYKGRVRVFELWNEPNVKRFYNGSVSQLVEMNRVAYVTIKKASPSSIVVSPSMSPCCSSLSFLDEYLALGGSDTFDVVGFHHYTAPRSPEYVLELHGRLLDVLKKHGVDKPIWNTETGWKVKNLDRNIPDSESWAGDALDDDLVGGYLARTYLLSWFIGIDRVYWYAWGHQSMGMTNYSGSHENRVSQAFERIQDWMLGAVVRSCQEKAPGAWECSLQKLNRSAKVYWRVSGRGSGAEKIISSGQWIQPLYGDDSFVPKGREVAIGELPILVASEKWL